MTECPGFTLKYYRQLKRINLHGGYGRVSVRLINETRLLKYW